MINLIKELFGFRNKIPDSVKREIREHDSRCRFNLSSKNIADFEAYIGRLERKYGDYFQSEREAVERYKNSRNIK
jgi:hypothetical protein